MRRAPAQFESVECEDVWLMLCHLHHSGFAEGAGTVRADMATIVLIPGADGRAWYWHRVAPLLRERGHAPLAVDLPIADAASGLAECTNAVLAAIADQPSADDDGLMIVGQSLGGFIAPLVCEQAGGQLLVLLNAMVPRPGESAGEWWSATRHAEARAPYGEFDLMRDFFHDVPPEVTNAAFSAPPPGGPSERIFADRWPLDRWPNVPTRVLQGVDDRFLPLEFQRRVVRERLGLQLDEMPGGHLLALSQPEELARRLDAYWTATAAPRTRE
jgi:pimeloyl-ACP methyl ester carboxylesterase